MRNRPIGIFDSGFGGLTALKRLRELMPDEDIIYFADSGRMPYGGRSEAELRCIARQNMEFLKGFDAKLIIAACGTLSSVAEDVLQSQGLPVIGVMRPGIERLARLPGEGPLGIIATAASIHSGRFKAELKKLCPDREIIDIACPRFVPLIEGGHCSSGDALLDEAVAEHLAPMQGRGMNGLLLGCTHYGIISDSIHAFLGDALPLVSASGSAAEEAAAFLRKEQLCGGSGRLKLYTSGNRDEFYSFASAFLGTGDFELEALPPMEVREP